MTKFPPLSNPNSFARAIVDRVKYVVGLPRNYRFNAKNGTLNFEDQQQITEPGSAFSIIPLAFRILDNVSLFNDEPRERFEVFFLNQSGHLCDLILHSYSVENLRRATAKYLSYEELSILDCVLTVRPVPRNHPKHGAYYVADFLFEEMPEEAKLRAAEMRSVLSPIYREETVCHPDLTTHAEGYCAPDFEAESTELTADIAK